MDFQKLISVPKCFLFLQMNDRASLWAEVIAKSEKTQKKFQVGVILSDTKNLGIGS
jgi:hypothetical protein